MINITDCVNKDTIQYNKLILKRKQKEIAKLDKDIINAGIKEEKAKTKYDIALTIEKQSKAEKKLRALEIARIKKEYKEKNIENPFTISLYGEKKTTLKEKYLIKQYQQLQ